MFYWPHCELTEWEKKFVRLYKTDKYPGVLRRTYRAILNAEADANIPGFDVARTSEQIQISRRSRVFALTFAGDTTRWRLNIETASGTQFTPKNVGAPQPTSAFTDLSGHHAPIVASMCPGAFYSDLSALGAPPTLLEEPDVFELVTYNQFQLPLLIEPNWQLVPNETLIFSGHPIAAGQSVLEITVHVWEFPDMDNDCPTDDPKGGK